MAHATTTSESASDPRVDELLRFMDAPGSLTPMDMDLNIQNMNATEVDALLQHLDMGLADHDHDTSAPIDMNLNIMEMAMMDNHDQAKPTRPQQPTHHPTSQDSPRPDLTCVPALEEPDLLGAEESTAAALLDELLETSTGMLARLSDDSADVARLSWSDLPPDEAASPTAVGPASPSLAMTSSESSESMCSGCPARSKVELGAASPLQELMSWTPPSPFQGSATTTVSTSSQVTQSPCTMCTTDEEQGFGSDFESDEERTKQKQQQKQQKEKERRDLEMRTTMARLAEESDSDDEDEADEEEEEEEDEVDVEDVEMEVAASTPQELDLLQKETKYLEAQYDYLVSRSRKGKAPRTSIKVSSKRRSMRSRVQQMQQSLDANDSMRQLVSQQKVFLENFRSMLAFAPVSDIRLALMTPLETYIHLGKDFHERRRTILELREEKLDMTYKYIEEKAAGIDCTQPYQYSDIFERFGKYYSVHFAISKYDGVDVRQVVKVVYDQMAGTDDSLSKAMGCMQIRESYDQIKCNFLHQRIISSLRWSDAFEEGLPELESNSLFLCRFAGDTAVFCTDYIDKDDLHPYQSTERVRKDVSSGVVLTAYTGPDGKKSVIMKRFLMTKFHVHPHNIPDKIARILMSGIPGCNKTFQTVIDKRMGTAKTAGKALPCCLPYFPVTPPKLAVAEQPDANPTVTQQCG